ncbi:HepT-like ribonuclease domain-containing protein [Sphaerimonospora thailandensis]|uniref:HepT-like ribonuclease domain-containing protein n=1 Tax=Sphaerimonospora thailandensis TaxID=795644 RepID=UPI00194F679B
MVEACRTIRRWLDTHGHRWDEDDLLRNAVLRQLMVIGEASACLSEDLRVELPEIPWREIHGFRNHAVHAYFRSVPVASPRRQRQAR